MGNHIAEVINNQNILDILKQSADKTGEVTSGQLFFETGEDETKDIFVKVVTVDKEGEVGHVIIGAHPDRRQA